MAESDTARASTSRCNNPISAHLDPANRGQVRIERNQQQRAVYEARSPPARRADHERRVERPRGNREHRAEHHRNRRPGRCCACVTSKYRNNAVRPRPAPSTIPVTRSRSRATIDAEIPSRTRPAPPCQKPEQRVDPEQKGGRAAGAADIGQRMAGEALAPMTVNTPITADTIAAPPPITERHAHRLIGEKPGGSMNQSSAVTCTASWAELGGLSPATTSTRPCTRITSIW